MDNVFPIDEAQLVAFGAECIFYGFYLVTFWMCMSELLSFTGGITVRRWPFFFVALILFSISTLDVAMGLLHLLDAFAFYRGPGGASAELLNISNWVSVMKTADYCGQTNIADGMLIYRSYVTYGRNWKVAAGLSVLWLGGLACGVYLVILEATLHQTSTLIASRFTPMALSVGAITLVLNTIASSLIVYRIWSIYRANNDISEEKLGGTTALRRAIRIIVESGAVYTLSVIILFVLDVTGSNSLYLTSDCVIQIIGIVFNLIIIRVEKGRTAEHNTYGDSKDLVSLQFQRRSTVGETMTYASALEAGEATRA